jgi:predicted permease
MSQFWSDLRFACRTLGAKPVFTVIAVLSLALGIGANTAIFSLIQGAVLRNLPFRAPDRLVHIGDHQPCCESVSLSPGEYLDYKHRNKAFQDIAAMAWQNMTLNGKGDAQSLRGRAVTTNFFEVLGAHPQLGRLMSSKIDTPNADSRVAVISDSLWKSKFASDPSVVGRNITLNGRPFKVVGVLAIHEEYPSDIQVWVSPRVTVPEYEEFGTQPMDIAQQYGNHWLQGLGRMKDGVPVAKARAELRTIADQIDRAHDETGHWATVSPLQAVVAGDVRPALAVLSTAVLVLLLIACANLAGMLLARASGRRRELAVRFAIGASRWEVTRLLLVESGILAFAGGLLGIALAYGGLRLLNLYSPYKFPEALAPSLNLPVLAFCIVVSVVAALASGLIPALTASQIDVQEGLKDASKGSSSLNSQKLRRTLVTGEIALSVMLLIGALLLIRSFSKILGVDPGFNPARVTTVQVSLPQTRYSEPKQIISFWDRLLANVKTIPGVESVGVSSAIPTYGIGSGADFEVEGIPAAKGKAPYADYLEIAPQTIPTLRIPLVSGRNLTEHDRENSNVILVNKTFADRFFTHQSAIGKKVRLGDKSPWETIVGVAQDVKWNGLDADKSLVIYRTYAQFERLTSAALMVRMKPGAAISLAQLQASVNVLDRDIAVSEFRSLDSYVDESLGQRRFLLALLTGFSGVAVLLAGMGLYAVLAYSVQQRRREIGIRVAVGATRSDVLSIVLGESLAIAGFGIIAGIVGAAWATLFLKSMLFGITQTDALAYGSAVLCILGATLAASLAPAMRAAQVDPVSALRYE